MADTRHCGVDGDGLIRVVVVDDEALVRSGFGLLLGVAPDIEVVASCSGGEALDTITREMPDVVLLEIRMPDVDGLTVLRQLRALPYPPVVAMLTTFDADEYIATALASGAAGFLLKDTDPAQLPALVRSLAAGGVVLSPGAAHALYRNTPARNAGTVEAVEQVGLLTSRERQVLRLVTQGLSNAAIGARMHLSPGTVKDHVSSILAKLRVGSRVEAALVAQRAGLIGDGSAGDR